MQTLAVRHNEPSSGIRGSLRLSLSGCIPTNMIISEARRCNDGSEKQRACVLASQMIASQMRVALLGYVLNCNLTTAQMYKCACKASRIQLRDVGMEVCHMFQSKAWAIPAVTTSFRIVLQSKGMLLHDVVLNIENLFSTSQGKHISW